jgi:hypothetical protein
MLAALDDTITEPIQIVIAGTRTSPAELLKVVAQYQPGQIVLLADGGENQEFLAQHVPEIADMTPINRQSNRVCLPQFCGRCSGDGSGCVKGEIVKPRCDRPGP